jgi:hypothetical protein
MPGVPTGETPVLPGLDRAAATEINQRVFWYLSA